MCLSLFFFFFNDTATPEFYPLSLHDALPISVPSRYSSAIGRCRYLALESGLPSFRRPSTGAAVLAIPSHRHRHPSRTGLRSEEHTSELQSQSNLVCRLLLEKKKSKKHYRITD